VSLFPPNSAKPAIFPPDFLVERVLFRDAMMLVIDKPAGIPVHQGPGGGPNLEQYFPALTFGLPRLPALAHRLDRDTSGCLILGRHRKALARMGKMFQNGRVEKTYWAIVAGVPAEASGQIDLPLLKVTRKDHWRMFPDPAGQPAVTDYTVMGTADGLSWVEFRPRTGRTHQIRVHAAAIGCPIVGDPVYGQPLAGMGLNLHSRGVTVPLYPTKDPITVTAPPPPHMLESLIACGWRV
jgi:tRNA pseudouridine32 synthase/23S rRNA pseudouridine746 synthase/23S rRNA pseudouridine1911/1915/1917 synthase